MRVLITGAEGQFGQHLLRRAPDSISVIGMSRVECDVTDLKSVSSAFQAFQPDLVINAAAYTAVDQAEADQQRAIDVNITGASNVGRASSALAARTIHLSTDYVFDGNSSVPYRPGSPTNPINVYGRTKLAGEAALSAVNADSLIVRTGWLYSAEPKRFVTKVLTELRLGRQVSVVQDQFGVPTGAADLATAIWRCAQNTSLQGLRHWVNSGTGTWYDFAVRIRERALDLGLMPNAPPVTPITSYQWKARASRPKYSVLDGSQLCTELGYPARHWHDALDEVLLEFRARSAF